MENCPNCESKLNTDEKCSGKCFSCGASFESILPKDKKTYSNDIRSNHNLKDNLCVFLILLFSIAFIICLYIYNDSYDEYISAKGKVARQKTDYMLANIWDLDSIDMTKLNAISFKRNMCMGGMIVSPIGIIICFIIKMSKPTDVYQSQNIRIGNANSSIECKLKELKSLYEKELITEEEYNTKKQDLLKQV